MTNTQPQLSRFDIFVDGTFVGFQIAATAAGAITRWCKRHNLTNTRGMSAVKVWTPGA